MSTTTTNVKASAETEMKSQLDILAEKAEAIRGELAAAQAAAEAENHAAEQRRAKAHEQFDRQTLAEFEEAPLDEAVDQARAALTEAVLADPVWQAVVRLNVALKRRVEAKSAYNSAASRLQAEPLPYLIASFWPVTLEDLSSIADREAAGQVADLADAYDQTRVDVGEKAARRRT